MFPALLSLRGSGQIARWRVSTIQRSIARGMASIVRLRQMSEETLDAQVNGIDALAQETRSYLEKNKYLCVSDEFLESLKHQYTSGKFGSSVASEAGSIVELICLGRLHDGCANLILGRACYGECGELQRVVRSLFLLCVHEQYDWAAKIVDFEPELRSEATGIYVASTMETKSLYRMAVEKLAYAKGFSRKEAALRFCELGVYADTTSSNHALRAFRRSVAKSFVAPAMLSSIVLSAGSGSLLTATNFMLLASFTLYVTWDIVMLRYASCLVPRIIPRLASDQHPGPGPYVICIPVLYKSLVQFEGVLERLGKNIRSCELGDAIWIVLIDLPEVKEASCVAEDEPLLDGCKRAFQRASSSFVGSRQTSAACMYRTRSRSQAQSCFMGNERKRGMLEDFVSMMITANASKLVLLEGDLPIGIGSSHFIVIDEDTELKPGAVAHLYSAANHPLNTPQGIGKTGVETYRGYGIICGSSYTRSDDAEWCLAKMFAPNIDDNNINVLRDTVFDVFGSRQFSGKGIINTRSYANLRKADLPDETILSHDTVEGAWLRTGYVAEARITEGFPRSFASVCGRQRRWLCGDFQNIIATLFPMLVPPMRRIRNAPTRLKAYLYLLLLRRCALVAMPLLALFVLMRGTPIAVAAAYALITLSVYVDIGNRLLRTFQRPRIRDLTAELLRSHARIATSLALSFHGGLLVLDSAARAYLRLLTGRGTLAWTSSFSFDSKSRRSFLAPLSIVNFVLVTLVLISTLSWELRQVPAMILLVSGAISPIALSFLSRDGK